MENRILVAYGTKYGATKEIAEKIGKVLQDEGASVEVMDIRRVKSLAPYSAVVLGSAVYMGFWRKEMARFIEKNAVELSQKMVWVFASGTTNEGDPVKDMGDRIYPPKLQPAMDMINPVDITAFHGAIDADKLSGFEKWVINKVKAPIGDFRDWNMIAKWAKGISTKL